MVTELSQPASSSEPAADDCLAGGGEMGALMRSLDWSKTPVGPVESWSPALRMMVRILLANRFPNMLWWGPRYIQFYNDAYRPIAGDKHPRSMGQPASECWSEIWPILSPLVDTPFNGGPATWMEDIFLEINRHGFVEETHFTIAYSPVPDETAPHGIGGVLGTVHEITEKVVGERRVLALRDLGARAAGAKSAEEACAVAADTLAAHEKDIPFALLYLIDADGKHARLAGAAGVPMGAGISPLVVDLTAAEGAGWPLAAAKRTEALQIVSSLGARFDAVPPGPWSDAPDTAVVAPIASNRPHEPAGFLVAGVSIRLQLDDFYRGFIELVTTQIATAIAQARAYEEERKRAEALAELDRAKTAFFSNVSHEFRTPLTLLLGPLEDALAEARDDRERERLDLAHRNALRLQKLVNTLLDFSRIEAGRIHAAYEPTDLAALTVDLASVFRSAVERAGMRLIIRCPPVSVPVYVDREMWEKIVLNLLSNAFKFTLDGEIEVSLHEAQDTVALAIRDTGTGIAPEQLPHVFERFHRIEGARARTHEGTGIGLALVQELAKLHGGMVEVESVPGEGSTFTVTLPKGTGHLPAEGLRGARTLVSTALSASHYAEEAWRWLPERPEAPDACGLPPAGAGPLPDPDGSARPPAARPRLVLADDNADMRDYVRRLLGTCYDVEAVPDGEAALAAVRREAPKLVMADVMMPRLDGFGLLRELRSDPATRTIPVIMLSARAGEEARVEGLAAGADDYLTKPFSARELLARVEAHLKMAALRAEAASREHKQREFLERLVTNAPIPIAVLEGPDLLYTLVNPAFQAVVGPAVTLLGRTFRETFPMTANPGAEKTLRQVLRTGERWRVRDFETRLPGRKGMTWWEGDVIPVLGLNGEPESLLLLAWEITERKRAEQNLRQQNERLKLLSEAAGQLLSAEDPETTARALFDQVAAELGLEASCDEMVAVRDQDRFTAEEREFLQTVCHYVAMAKERQRLMSELDERAERLAEADRRKDEFLAMLAHELRNPLAPILNAAQIQGMLDPGDPRLVKQREVIKRQVEQMKRLLDDLLDVSRITRNKIELRLERLELAAVLGEAVDTSRPLLEEKQHQLAVTLPPETVWLEADRTRIAQVFTNLLNNAAKYTDPGGQVALLAELEGGDIVVRVRDTGIGMAPEVLAGVFDLFAQAERSLDRSQGGLGIGLTIARRLVEKHGGEVSAHSAGLGRGSEFVVRLPVHAIEPGAGGQRTAAGPLHAAPSTVRRILVVDDNADAAESLAQLLALDGHELFQAYDGAGAICAARAHRPDVILLDIGLPGRSGYEVAQQLRGDPQLQGALLVAISGYGQEEDRHRSRAAGFDHHLVKPVDFAALQALLGPRVTRSAGE